MAQSIPSIPSPPPPPPDLFAHILKENDQCLTNSQEAEGGGGRGEGACLESTEPLSLFLRNEGYQFVSCLQFLKIIFCLDFVQTSQIQNIIIVFNQPCCHVNDQNLTFNIINVVS